uniref:FERM domain-containing protein n=1 Tax=Astatotilapia calliptera TaxID=8154 RepID=A0A3P8QT87_ASTCA
MAVRIMRGMEDLVASGSQLVWSLAHQTLRSWYNRGLMPCRHSEVFWCCFTGGRLCQVHLLDDRKLELLVQPKLLSRELLDLVASHFNLKEKEYFGLCFIDDTGQSNWLQLDRKVLDHYFSKTSGPLELKFLVRFYIEKITLLKDNTTVELFFLNAKSLVFNVSVCEIFFPHSSAETATSDLKQLPVLPTRVLREHPSLNYCESVVYLHVCAFLQDKQGIPWWLGVSYKGIGQYDWQDKLKPRQLFQWKQLENLYFREKKFSVEVNDPHRRAVTKRTFGQSGLVIHTWYASHSLIKTIWVMAISQHQFYLDMKQSKSKMTTTRSSGDIAVDLTEISAPRITKLSSIESKNHLIMASNGSLISTGSADSEVSEEQKKEKIAELKKKEKELQDKLSAKLEELKKICLREAELTGRLPKEYPLATGEKVPHVRRRVGTAFKLDDLFPYDEDPHLRNLESRFALQQKIVEAAMKLANEADLCKTVKRKRKHNYLDAMRNLEEIEKQINDYRVKKGQKPTQRASLILRDDPQPSELSSLSDSLTLDDDDELGSQRQRSRSVQYSPRPHHADTLDAHYNKDRRASANDQLADTHHYSHNDTLSVYSSPCKAASRQPRDARSMPPTPLLTRNAYSSTQLRSEDSPQHFRQRSGSLESQSQLMIETKPSMPTLTVPSARRSNSTEMLDDGSSYTSQSSVEYSVPGNHHTHGRRVRGRHRKDMYANTGSMPNLAQPDTRCYGYQPRARPTTTAYYVTGYPNYAEPEPYSNGVYVYDNEMEGHYNVNPSYHHTQTAYQSPSVYGHYGNDEIDGASQNVYATIRPSRQRPVPRSNEQINKNIQKALVAEHLRGWYKRNTAQKQAAYDYEYDRGSQQSLGYPTTHAPQAYSSRNLSYSSVASSGNWHSHMTGSAMLEYDMPVHAPSSSSGYPSTSSLPSSSFPSSSPSSYYSPGCRVSQMHTNMDPEEQLYWHEDSKPGTIV